MASKPVTKSATAFRTISEASEIVGAPQHVLRFWETKFTFIAPVKRAGGRRFYRPQDIVLLKAIRRLLHDEGLTIKGVQRLHKEQGLTRLAAYGEPGAAFAMDAASTPETHDEAWLDAMAEMSPSAPVVPSMSANDISRLRGVLADLETARRHLDAVLGH